VFSIKLKSTPTRDKIIGNENNLNCGKAMLTEPEKMEKHN